MANAAAFLDQAKNELKELAHAKGLKVDSSATYALESILGTALAKAEQTEGPRGFTRQRQIEFDRTAVCLAVEATKAARQGHVRVIGGAHIDSATDTLRAWKFWPFTGD